VAGRALLLVVLAVAGTVLYFLPTIVGAARGAARMGVIFLLNLLFGWSLVGWLVALVLALRAAPPVLHPGPPPGAPWGGAVPPRQVPPPPAGPPAGWYPDPGGSGGLRLWDGRTWTAQLRPPR
jgi:hypothetical protein